MKTNHKKAEPQTGYSTGESTAVSLTWRAPAHKLRTTPSTFVQRHSKAGLNKLLDVILDKGTVVDSKTKICFNDINLVDAKSHIALSSLETAKRINLKFPANTNFDTQAWRDLSEKQSCPLCGKNATEQEFTAGCPWCGYTLNQYEE
jgi:hypothetical protein